jgi:hypothetical protein
LESQNLVDYLFKSNIDENEHSDEIHKLFNKINLQNDEIKRRQFEYLLEKLILSCSPFVKYKIPFLLSEIGNKYSSLRKYVPSDYTNYYNSNILSSLNLNEELKFKINVQKKLKNNSIEVINLDLDNNWPYNYEKKMKNPHEFLKIHLIKSVNDSEIKVCCWL